MLQRKPIQYNHDQGQLLYAVLQRQPGIQAHIERSDGRTLGQSWSVPCVGVSLGTNEFVANTWGDTAGLMASAMMGTGWFERTGRSVCFPQGEVNEVWRLSKLGLEWLQAAIVTISAMREARAGNLKSFGSVGALMADLHAED